MGVISRLSLLIILSIVLNSVCIASVYQCMGKDGIITYQEEPCLASTLIEQVELPLDITDFNNNALDKKAAKKLRRKLAQQRRQAAQQLRRDRKQQQRADKQRLQYERRKERDAKVCSHAGFNIKDINDQLRRGCTIKQSQSLNRKLKYYMHMQEKYCDTASN